MTLQLQIKLDSNWLKRETKRVQRGLKLAMKNQPLALQLLMWRLKNGI